MLGLCGLPPDLFLEERVDNVQQGLAVFSVVLVFGTIFRLLSFHAMASPNVHLQHIGMAMAVQY